MKNKKLKRAVLLAEVFIMGIAVYDNRILWLMALVGAVTCFAVSLKWNFRRTDKLFCACVLVATILNCTYFSDKIDYWIQIKSYWLLQLLFFIILISFLVYFLKFWRRGNKIYADNENDKMLRYYKIKKTNRTISLIILACIFPLLVGVVYNAFVYQKEFVRIDSLQTLEELSAKDRAKILLLSDVNHREMERFELERKKSSLGSLALSSEQDTEIEGEYLLYQYRETKKSSTFKTVKYSAVRFLLLQKINIGICLRI